MQENKRCVHLLAATRRNTWRMTPPGHQSHGQWPLKKSHLIHRSSTFFSANKRLVWGSQPCPTSSGHLGRVGGPNRPTHLTTCAHLFPSTALVSITSMWNVEHSVGFRLIALEELGPGKNTRLAGHMQSGHLTTLRLLELGRDGMGTH